MTQQQWAQPLAISCSKMWSKGCGLGSPGNFFSVRKGKLGNWWTGRCGGPGSAVLMAGLEYLRCVFQPYLLHHCVVYSVWPSRGSYLGLTLKTAQHLKNAYELHRGTLIIKQRMMCGERREKKRGGTAWKGQREEGREADGMVVFFQTCAVNQNFWGDLIFCFILWNSDSSQGKVT